MARFEREKRKNEEVQQYSHLANRRVLLRSSVSVYIYRALYSGSILAPYGVLASFPVPAEGGVPSFLAALP